MSIILSASQLCKHVLKISEDVFNKRKSRAGFYQKSIGENTGKVWENLEKIFPSTAQIVKENVSQKKMYDSVRTLLVGKQTESVVLYEFSEERETRQGEK